jgi:epoxyqueuosine reductase
MFVPGTRVLLKKRVDFQPFPENLSPKLAELAIISDQEHSERFQGSPLRRIKAWMLRRNARANLRIREVQ